MGNEPVPPEVKFSTTLEDIRQCKTQFWLNTSYVLAINGFMINIAATSERLNLAIRMLMPMIGMAVACAGILLLILHSNDLARYRQDKIDLRIEYKWPSRYKDHDKVIKGPDVVMVVFMALAMLGSSILLCVFCFAS